MITLGVGAGLAVAWATMRAITRNPLASPSILGVSSGASFAVVTAVFYLGLSNVQDCVWFAFFDAIVASALVFTIGSGGDSQNAPVRLTLAGVAVSAIVGPNACGKSTLLRTIARLQSARSGELFPHDINIRRCSQRRLARDLAMLSQGAVAPAGLRVDELVSLGRFPHHGLFRQWCDRGERMTDGAVCDRRLDMLRSRDIETLSGGQRQRAWFAMALAQDTPILFLDEPTTFLDISARLEMLDMVRRLNRDEGRTIVMVLHDPNVAAHCAGQPDRDGGRSDRRHGPPVRRDRRGAAAGRLRDRRRGQEGHEDWSTARSRSIVNTPASHLAVA